MGEGSPASLKQRGEMLLNSSDSLSAEETHSNTPGSEGEGDKTGRRGMKRKEKNRDAARKSRRKQTERADELHEELQCLEQSNLALEKEVASLKTELDIYTMALERHEPFCCLQGAASVSNLTTSLLAKCRATPTSSRSTASPLSTSLTSSLSPQTLDCVESTRLSPSTPSKLSLSAGSSNESFASSSFVAAPYSLQPAPHLLFSDEVVTAAMPELWRHVANEHSMSSNASLHSSDSLDAFLRASSNVVPPYSQFALENASLAAQSCPVDVAQVHPDHLSGNPINSNHSLLTASFQDPVCQSPSVNLGPSPALPFASNSEHIGTTPALLLSMLSVPDPIGVPPTTSSTFGSSLAQAPTSPSPPSPWGTLRDRSLLELIEINDWILQ